MYDVIVVGGGLVGSYVAYKLAGKGHRVVVLERKKRIGEKVCCTGIIGMECVSSFDIESDVILRQVNSARLFSPSGNYYPSIKINDNLMLTTAKEILIDIAKGKGPGQFLFTLGFAGWAPGQLEYELMTDGWLIAPVNNKIVFDIPVTERWKAAADSIGVDLTRLVYKQGRV